LRGTSFGMNFVEIARRGTNPPDNSKEEPCPLKKATPSNTSTVIDLASEERLLARHGRTFHFAARFFSFRLRRSILTLYAFFRTLDDMVDELQEGCQSEGVREELQAWQAWFRAEGSLVAPREPLGKRLATVVADYHIPTVLFLDFLAGLSSDLEAQEMGTFEELYHYCYSVAGTVGRALAHVMGATSAQALRAAEHLGIAMQLTNILRDVGTDLTAGRVYLPQDELARFGSSRAHLSQLMQERRGPDARFRALMRYQVARASGYYMQSMPGIWLLPLQCRLPVLLAARLYRRILRVIVRKDYDVLRSRAATNLAEKVGEALIAFVLDRLWRDGEAYLCPEVEASFED
jgi:phytoene synthase